MVGPGGAGKSYLSRQLRDILKLPLYPLDTIFWNKDKSHISREEFDEKLEEILKLDKWIIDGDYSRTYERRLIRSDMIIFLDYPLEICLEGAESRVGKWHEDLPWLEESFDPEFKDWIISWHQNKRPQLLDLINQYKKEKNIIILHSRDEADKYINELKEIVN